MEAIMNRNSPMGVSSKDQRLETIMVSYNSLFTKVLNKLSAQDTGNSGNGKDDSKGIIDLIEKQTSATERASEKARASLSKALKENMPSFDSVLSAVGLKNPITDFIGNTMKNVFNQQKELSSNASKEIESQKVANDKLEGLEGDTNSILKEHSNKLDIIGSYLNAMVSGGQADKFNQIEMDRERIRRDESLIDAVNGINDKGLTTSKESKSGGGFFSGITDNLIQALIGGGTGAAIVTSLTTLLGAAIPAALVSLAGVGLYKIYNRVSDGWENAADKLGKEFATTSDQWASSMGSFLAGGITGIIDDIAGMFGFRPELQKSATDTTAKVLADAFDFFSDFENNFKQLYTDISKWFTTKIKSITDFFNSPAQEGVDKIKGAAASLKNTLLDKFNGVKTAINNFDVSDVISGKKKNALMKPGKNDEEIKQFYMSKGLTEEQATGVLANIKAESGGDPNVKPGDGGLAIGIEQWHPARQADFKKLFGHELKGSPLQEQLDFSWWELNNTHKSALDKLKNAKTAGESAAVFSKHVEKPYYKITEAKKRADLAEQLLAESKRKQLEISNLKMSNNLNQMPQTNTSLRKADYTDILNKDGVQRDKEMRSHGIGAIVNAPKSTRVSNTTNNNSYVGVVASPRDTDSSIHMVGGSVAY